MVSTWLHRLISAEVVPTEARSKCFGFAAACGTIGAIVAHEVFKTIPDQEKFTNCAVTGLLGFVLTYLFTPDLTGLDLRDGDIRWLTMLEGKDVYSGEAVNPLNLSTVERWIGYGKQYKFAGKSAGPQTPLLMAGASSDEDLLAVGSAAKAMPASEASLGAP